jgi:hypothetical protein
MNESLKQSGFLAIVKILAKISSRTFFHVCRICLLSPLRSENGERKVERGAETILGTEPARNAAVRFLTEADAAAFPLLAQGTSGREMTKAGRSDISGAAESVPARWSRRLYSRFKNK